MIHVLALHTLHSDLTLVHSASSCHTPGLTHLEYDPSAVHPGGDGGLLIRAGLVSSFAPLTNGSPVELTAEVL